MSALSEVEYRVFGPQFSPKLIEKMNECRLVWGMRFPVISDALLLPHLIELQRQTIERFCDIVEREAETSGRNESQWETMLRLRNALKRVVAEPKHNLGLS